MTEIPENITIAMQFSSKSVSVQYKKILFYKKELRYGENPDQKAALYSPQDALLELQGDKKIPGKNNISDADAALRMLRYFSHTPAAIIIKHRNPCGVAVAPSIEEAFVRAWEADSIAAFGGVIALNRSLTRELASLLQQHFFEVLLAPDFEEGALDLVQKKNRLIFKIPEADLLSAIPDVLNFSSLMDGSLILQSAYQPNLISEWTPAQTQYKGISHLIAREPTEKEKRDMQFGWFVQSGTLSNSIVYVKDGTTVGIAVGEQDRVGAAALARDKAVRNRKALLSIQLFQSTYAHLTPSQQQEISDMISKDNAGLRGSVMVSDGFFPFPDGVEVGLEAGASAILQPGGSIRDYQSIEVCNKAGATMIFTGQRSFVH